MNNHCLNINHLLLSLLFVVTSCNAQVKTDLTNENTNQQTPIKGDQPKIVQTQGVTSGNITCELQDRDGNLWFSTSGVPLFRLNQGISWSAQMQEYVSMMGKILVNILNQIVWLNLTLPACWKTEWVTFGLAQWIKEFIGMMVLTFLIFFTNMSTHS